MLADLDGDGGLDLAGVSHYEQVLGLLRSPGAAVGRPTEHYGATMRPRGLALADLDGDGDLDVCIADVRGLVVIENRCR